MTHISTGSLRDKILELAARTGTTPAEALEAAIQDKLERLEGRYAADLDPDDWESDDSTTVLTAAEELYEYDYDSDYD